MWEAVKNAFHAEAGGDWTELAVNIKFTDFFLKFSYREIMWPEFLSSQFGSPEMQFIKCQWMFEILLWTQSPLKFSFKPTQQKSSFGLKYS